MKTSRRTITFFSFFPVAALLATPLMFSTLAPASNDFWTAEDVDDFSFAIPQSQLVLEEELGAGDARNGDIGEVKFLQYDRDYIYMAEDGETDVNSDAADFRNEPAITDSGEVDTAYVLQNPEFQRQVEEVSAQAQQAGAAMPPLLTLVALFAFAMATGSATLKEFFKFSTYTEKVKKTIQVTKKVAKTVYKTITEVVPRVIKTVKTVAYTAYETVKNIAYNTRTWVETVVKAKPQNEFDMMKNTAKFINENFAKYTSKFSNSFQRNARYILPLNLSQYDRLKAEADKINSGKIAPKSRYAQNVWKDVSNERQTLNHITGQFFGGIEDVKLAEKLKKELKEIQLPTYTEQVTHSETTPVVTYVEKPYTAYRDEIETKTVYDTISREVPETIYEDVTEDREITEDVTKYAFTPLNEKIDLAMSYLKNYSRILQNPSNRNFSDDALLPNRDLPLFAGAYDVYKQLGVELKDANIYNMDRSDPKEVGKLLRRHNEFIYSMKAILTKIQKGQTPEEQMEILFGKDYTDSVIANENAMAEIEAQEKAVSARFEEIYGMAKTGKISTGYYNTLYNSAKKNRDQVFRRKRDALKNLKEAKEFYARKFNATVSSLQNLSFLRTLDDWRNVLTSGERTTASRLVPFTTANGSVIYRKPAQTTTQAQPKKTLQKAPAANLTASASPADLQTASFWSRVKGFFGKDKAKTTKTATPARTMATITADDLNVRSEPSDANKDTIITQLNSGDKVEIIGKSPDEKWLKIKLEGITGETWIINNNDWVKTPSLKNVPVVKVPKPVYVPGEYSLAGDPTVRKAENHVLNTIVKNPPVNGLGSAWIATLGSGWHDDSAFHALDLGMGSNADKGKDVVAVADGTISKINLSYGSVMIDHPKGKDTPAWQSNYLHMPLYKAVDTPKEPEVIPTDRLTEGGKQIYVLHTADTVDKDGNFVEGTEIEGFEIWEGMEVKTGDKIGVIDGRGPSSKGDAGLDEDGKAISEDSFRDHLHFETRLNNKTVNMALAAQNGWGVSVTAIANDGYDSTSSVGWSNKVDIGNLGGAWVNDTEKLIFYRDPSITADSINDHWRAWELDAKGNPITDVGQLKKVVVNQKIGTNKMTKKEVYAWIHTNSDGVVSVWNNDINSQFRFTDLREYKLTLGVE